MVLTKEDVAEIVKMLLINHQKQLQGYVIAKLYFKIGEYRTAVKHVSNYLRVKPNSFLAWKLQAECYDKLGRANEALQSYQKAIHSVEKEKKLKRQDFSSIFSENEEKSGAFQSSTACDQSENEEMQSPCPTSTTELAIHHTEMDGDEMCSEATFKFTVKYISTLDCVVSSQLFAFKNSSWRIFLMPMRDFGVNRTLAFYLVCNQDNYTSEWSHNVEAEYRLLSCKHDQYPYVLKLRHLFDNQENMWGFPRFISWNDVVNPDSIYMQNDCITVEVRIVALD